MADSSTDQQSYNQVRTPSQELTVNSITTTTATTNGQNTKSRPSDAYKKHAHHAKTASLEMMENHTVEETLFSELCLCKFIVEWPFILCLLILFVLIIIIFIDSAYFELSDQGNRTFLVEGNKYVDSYDSFNLASQFIADNSVDNSTILPQTQKKQSIITTCKFSSIQHEKNFILLLIGTESGHIHLYNIDMINSKSIKVQTIRIDDIKKKMGEEIRFLLWCKLEKLLSNYNNNLHNIRGSKLDALDINENEAAQVAAIESLKIIVSVSSGKIYLLHLMSNYISTTRQDTPVKIINLQLIYSCKSDDIPIVQMSFKQHFVLVSCLTKCFILDFSKIYNINRLQEREKAIRENKNHFHSLPFVNGANMESMKYFINIYYVGRRARNGYYGACFDCQSIDGCDQILSARKSGRVWVGETQSGSVRNTLRFKLPKLPNVFDENNDGTTSEIEMINDLIWSKEIDQKPEDEEEEEEKDEVLPEFANVSGTVCQQLGILIPFGNWTLSYLHPCDINNEKSLELDVNKLTFLKYKTVNKNKKRVGYHEKLNTFGLKILDHNLPKCIQWYPNLGKIIDIAVLESQCCFYMIYKPLIHSINSSKVILGKVELCSPNESVKSLIQNNQITVAIDYICAYKVRDMQILENVKKILLKREQTEESSDNNNENKLIEIVKNLDVNIIHKFDVHFEETKQFYDDHNITPIDLSETAENKPQQINTDSLELKEEEDDMNSRDKFTKYRKASLDYEASQKISQLTDRRKGKNENIENMKWEPAKFDVTAAQVLDDTIGSPQVVITDSPQVVKEKESDIFSAKKWMSMGKKMVKTISKTTVNITSDLMGNSPQPNDSMTSISPLPPIDFKEEKNEIENKQQTSENNSIENMNEKEAEMEAMDSFADLDSVQTLHFKQKQNVARARRKSSATQQVFLEASEDEPMKTKYKDKKKKKKRKKKKAKFTTIDPAPKQEKSNKKSTPKQLDIGKKVTHVAAAGSGSILALDPDVKPHEVIYGSDGELVSIKPEKIEPEKKVIGAEPSSPNNNISKIHKLLQQTSKCDSMLRRRMRNELEELYENNNNMNDNDIIEESEPKFAAVGLSNINYRTCPNLMNKMSNLLGEYEGQINEFNSTYFYKWTNKIGEKLSTVLTRMLCVFISVKIDIGKESETGVFEIFKKFLLILDFEWILKLCNTHKLYNTLRQLATLQYEQNNVCFNRIEIEKAYLMQNYQTLIKLIDKYRSPLLVLQYLPLLCEKGYSHICYTIAVGYFPHVSPWFVRKYMYRYAIDQKNKLEKELWNNIFKSYLKYLKLLFNIHPRTRCNGLLVLDLITLTLSLNASNESLLFRPVEENENEVDDEEKKTNVFIPKGYTVPTVYNKYKIPLIRSENKYSDGLTKYIISIMNDRSYYIEWSYLEIVFKEYGFWKGLYKVYYHFQDIESIILLCVYLDYAQPILQLLCDLCKKKYWKNLLFALSYVYENKNERNNRLNLEIVIKYMMRNIGAAQTLECLTDNNIIAILNGNINNIIYKQIVKQQQQEYKRNKLISSVQTSLSNYLLSQYTLNSISGRRNKHIQKKYDENNNDEEITPEFKKLIDTLSNIKHSSDEWTVMSSVNVRPPTQRAAAPLEKNLTDLFVQFI